MDKDASLKRWLHVEARFKVLLDWIRLLWEVWSLRQEQDDGEDDKDREEAFGMNGERQDKEEDHEDESWDWAIFGAKQNIDLRWIN